MKIRSITLSIIIGTSMLGNICIAPLALAVEIPTEKTAPMIIGELMSPMIPMSYANQEQLVRIEANTASSSCNGHCFAPSSDTHAANVTSGTYEIFASLPTKEKGEWHTVLVKKNDASFYSPPQETSSDSIVLRL